MLVGLLICANHLVQLILCTGWCHVCWQSILNLHHSVINLSPVVLLDGRCRSGCLDVNKSGWAQVMPVHIGVKVAWNQRSTLGKENMHVSDSHRVGVDVAHFKLALAESTLDDLNLLDDLLLLHNGLPLGWWCVLDNCLLLLLMVLLDRHWLILDDRLHHDVWLSLFLHHLLLGIPHNYRLLMHHLCLNKII